MTGLDDITVAYEGALNLAAKYEENFVELGRQLRLLQDHNLDLFKGVCSETGLGTRKAYYLARMSRQIEKLSIPDQELIDVGWTKVAAIGLRFNTANWKELIKLARQHTVHNLKIILNGGEPVPGTRCVQFYFKPRQYEVFAKAILQHGGKADGKGVLSRERALMTLIQKALAA